MYNRLLDTFLTAADAGSFSKAAARLYCTPVSVMNQINSLEKHIGVLLLTRTSRGVILTPAGRSLYDDALKLKAASQAAVEKARAIAAKDRSVIRMGTSILRPCRIFLDMWEPAGQFQLKIVPFDDSPAGMAAMLSSLGKDIDCFISPCDSVRWRRDYAVKELGAFPCAVAVPKTHALAKKTSLRLSDLTEQSLLLVKKGESPVLDCMRSDIETNYPSIHIIDIANFYDLDVFNQCKERGCAMETLPIWDGIHPSLVTIPLAEDYAVPFGIIYSRTPSPSFSAFLRLWNGGKTAP